MAAIQELKDLGSFAAGSGDGPRHEQKPEVFSEEGSDCIDGGRADDVRSKAAASFKKEISNPSSVAAGSGDSGPRHKQKPEGGFDLTDSRASDVRTSHYYAMKSDPGPSPADDSRRSIGIAYSQ